MRNLFVTTGSAWLSRLLLAAGQVYTIPILVRTLHTEEYAAHVLLAALAPWFLLADLGLGTALQNYVARFVGAHGHGDRVLNRWLDRSAVICAVVVTLVLVSSPVIAPLLFDRFTVLSASMQPKLLSLATLLYICGTLGNVAYKCWYAMGLGWRANVATGLAGLMTLASIHALQGFASDVRLYAAIGITVGPQALMGLLAFAICRARKTATDAIEGDAIDAPSAVAPARSVGADPESQGMTLWNTALRFLGFNVMAAMILNVDYLLIARLMKPEDLVIYGLITRIYGLFWMLYSTALQALWPICTRLLHDHQYHRADIAVRQMLAAGLLGLACFAGCCMVAIEPLFGLLTGNKVAAPAVSLLVAFAAYYAIRVWTDTFAMVLQSHNKLRVLYQFAPMQVLLSVGFQVVLIPLYGLPGALMGLMGSYLLTVSWVLPRHAVQLLRRPK